jgi:hypothetical protein
VQSDPPLAGECGDLLHLGEIKDLAHDAAHRRLDRDCANRRMHSSGFDTSQLGLHVGQGERRPTRCGGTSVRPLSCWAQSPSSL